MGRGGGGGGGPRAEWERVCVKTDSLQPYKPNASQEPYTSSPNSLLRDFLCAFVGHVCYLSIL